MMNRLLSGLVLSVTLLSAGCHAEPAKQTQGAITPDWKTECVGRYQVGVPGEVEVAVIAYKHWFDENNPSPYRFGDDTVAPFSGGIETSSIVNASEYAFLRKKLQNNGDKSNQEMRDSYANDLSNLVKPYTTGYPYSFGWQDKNGIRVFIYSNHRIINYPSRQENEIQRFLTHFHPRALYEIPSQPGVCFPYGFIADDGKAPRSVAVTMRLVDHPDVEVFFKDGSDPYGYTADTNTPEVQLRSFWDGYSRDDLIKIIKMDTHYFHDIHIGEQSGKAAIVTITNRNGTTDYGYAAATVADFDRKTSAPSQMIYVIRTASRAIAKGIQPVSKEQIKDIAEQMMASIKRHPE
jgi:hypothetical protein